MYSIYNTKSFLLLLQKIIQIKNCTLLCYYYIFIQNNNNNNNMLEICIVL